MTKSYSQTAKMKPNHLYYCYETGRTMIYLETDDGDNLVLMQNKHGVFVNAEDNEHLKYSYSELGIANEKFIITQLKYLDQIHDTLSHIKKAFVVSQLAQMLSDDAPDVEGTVGTDNRALEYPLEKIYHTVNDMLVKDLKCPCKLVQTNRTDKGINFKAVFDEDKKKAIMETDEYKEFERRTLSTNPSINDLLKTLFDTVLDDAEKPDSSKNSSDMII